MLFQYKALFDRFTQELFNYQGEDTLICLCFYFLIRVQIL